MNNASWSLGFLLISLIKLFYGETCPKTVSLSSMNMVNAVKSGSDISEVYQTTGLFPCNGQMTRWNVNGKIPNFRVYIGIWNSVGENKGYLIEKFEISSGSDHPVPRENVKITPVNLKFGDFMGLVFLKKDVDITTVNSISSNPLSQTSKHNDTYIGMFLDDIPKVGSVIKFDEAPYVVLPLEFSFEAEMDSPGKTNEEPGVTKRNSVMLRNKSKTRCHENCVSCKKKSGKYVCIKCREGFYGKLCKNKCQENCNICDQNSGDCTSCVAGLFGKDCEETCPTRCVASSGCSNSNGCSKCILGWTGKWCKESVKNCKGGDFGSLTCQNKCPRPFKCNKCNRTKDECYVCKRGSKWKICKVSDDEISPKLAPDSSPVGAIVGAVIGIVIIGVLVVIFVILYKRRRRQSAQLNTEGQTEEQSGMLESVELSPRMTKSHSVHRNDYENGNQKRKSAMAGRPLPDPFATDEDGYMAPQARASSDVPSEMAPDVPSVTAPLLEKMQKCPDQSTSKNVESEEVQNEETAEKIYDVIEDGIQELKDKQDEQKSDKN